MASFLDYDYDDLAQQVQTGLERLGISFLRSHGARVKRDLVDFHGYEQLDLELEHNGHILKVHQVGRPKGPGMSPAETAETLLEEAYESTFDGWPALNTPADTIADWLRGLPAGDAPPEKKSTSNDPANPFAADRPAASFALDETPISDPFLFSEKRQSSVGGNPFADTDRERKRQEMLRRLAGDEAQDD